MMFNLLNLWAQEYSILEIQNCSQFCWGQLTTVWTSSGEGGADSAEGEEEGEGSAEEVPRDEL